MGNKKAAIFISRREFLHKAGALGGAAALAAWLEGCSPEPEGVSTAVQEMPASTISSAHAETAISPAVPSQVNLQDMPSPVPPTLAAAETPVAFPDDGRARIALVKTTDRAAGVRQAVSLLGINPVDGKSIFLKPNFNSADPAPGSTHPEILTALVGLLKEMGASKITAGDRSGMGDTRAVMEQLGIFHLAEGVGFEALVFDELSAGDWVRIDPPGSHWRNGFYFARPVLDADAVVQTCCLKTHRYGGHFTLSLKNSVGLAAHRLPGKSYNYMTEMHNSIHQRRMIAEINTAYTPALIVMDGVEAFISGGPDIGEKVSPGVVLAGTDRIAVDAVGVALLRCHGCRTEAGQGRIFDQEQIARAVELGLGVNGPEKIDFLTGDEDSAAASEDIRQVLLAG